MKKLILAFIFGLTTLLSFAQKSDRTPLFQDEKILDLKLRVSIKGIKKKTNDSTYLDSWFGYKNENGNWDSLKISIRARGIFRRNQCYFPPIRIKLDKSDAKGTLLAGNKSLKLVLPCLNSNDKNSLIVKEYIGYKMYEQVSPYTFSTRLVNIEFLEDDGKKVKKFQLTGILIENDNLVAKRHHAKVMEMKLHPMALNDTCALYHDLFQFMIGNTDWSTSFLHNSKLIYQAPKKYIPLTYDFDMSGLVNPSYGVVTEDLGIANLRERLYRGYCRTDGVTQAVRKSYIEKEGGIMAILDSHKNDLSAYDFEDTRKFLAQFFAIMKNDKLFDQYITSICRK